MVCPFCTSNKTSVYNSRATARLNNVWRRRRCNNCKKVFTTTETVDPASVIKLKQGKTSVAFSQAKLLISLLRVCDHLEDPETSAHYLCQNVMQKLYRMAAKSSQTINKNDIIEVTMVTLKPYNLAAYVKYLSYHSPQIDPRTLNKKLKETTTF